jgi:mono/diheme cytochrome c family protein
MKMKIIKVVVALVFVVFAGLAFGYVYVVKFRPNVAVEDLKVELTPERIERGKYLANEVAGCIYCHSTRDWSKFSGPVTPGTEGKGGDLFDRKLGFPGEFYAPNITPHNLKSWSDGEIFRAVTAGVSKDGRPLFPSMPYTNYGQLDREDIYAIIAYLRTIPSVESSVPAAKLEFPMSFFVHLIPRKGELPQRPAVTDKVAYGKYLTTMASCSECHTQTKRGMPVEGMEFGGGKYLSIPDGTTVVSANITPDKKTGIGAWSEEMFVERFRAFGDGQSNAPETVKPGDFNSTMPWKVYAKMSREDLAAIYAYLQTLKPINNPVQKTTVKSSSSPK